MTQISRSKYFTEIDLSKGCWQIPLDENSKEITAFQTSKGLMRFMTMPFGIASATFNRMARKMFYFMSNIKIFVGDILRLD